MKPPISYYGGKTRLAHKLAPLIPIHRTYVEVFGGSAALLCYKEPSGVEVYNDIDGDLVNLFRVIRNPEHFARFRDLLQLDELLA